MDSRESSFVGILEGKAQDSVFVKLLNIAILSGIFAEKSFYNLLRLNRLTPQKVNDRIPVYKRIKIMLTNHITERLNERHIKLNPAIIEQLANSAKTDSAVLITKLNNHIGSTNNDYYSRAESNGNLVFLIIRGNKPITIMYRRDNQPMTTNALRVNAIIDLSNELSGYIRIN